MNDYLFSNISLIPQKVLSSDIKSHILHELSKNLILHTDEILEANIRDINILQEKDETFIDRLKLDKKRIAQMAKSVSQIANLEDPCGKVIKSWHVTHNNLHISRITKPIGNILIIYEARPNVTIDAFSIAFKSSNNVILRGGKESIMTSTKLVEIIHKTFDQCNIAEYKNSVQYIGTPDRSILYDLLKRKDFIDLVIPRGGRSLVESVYEHSKIPVLKHLDGNCHTYIENTAIPDLAINVLVNAKMRRVSICSATESIVIDREFAIKYLSNIVDKLQGCELYGCEHSVDLDSRIKPADVEDYKTEFLSHKASIKIVNNYKEAIEFINAHSSFHTDAILSENQNAVSEFLTCVNSAVIMHNASTQFSDGYEFGFGGEIGISTDKLHARGPVSINELVTYTNFVEGKYDVRV